MKKRPRLPGFDRMTNALEIVRKHNEDVDQWLAQHIGNLRDERERMTEEISRLKRRVSRLEKRLMPNAPDEPRGVSK